MNDQMTRLGFLTLLAILLIGCGGRAHQPEATSPPTSPEAMAAKAPEKATSAEPVSFQETTVTASRLNLRDKGSAKGQVVGVLKKDDQLEILSHSGDWLEVTTSDGKKGWVYGHYVQTSDKIPTKAFKSEKPATAPPKAQSTKTKSMTLSKTAEIPQPQAGQNKDSALRKQLETIWETRRLAHKNGDLNIIRNTTSNHTQGTLQNQLAAVGKELRPEDAAVFFDMMPDLTELKFIELKQNGPTAGLLYLDEGEKSEDPNLPPPIRFVFIKFVKEARGWTVDGMQSTGMSKYQKDGSEAQFDYANFTEELALDGKVRPAPKTVEKPKEPVVKGVLDISSYDYLTKVTINGTLQEETEGTNSSGHIAGGLKKGENTIEIVVTQSAKAQSDWPPEVAIRYLDRSGKEQEAFKFAPEENVEGTHEFTFMVE